MTRTRRARAARRPSSLKESAMDAVSMVVARDGTRLHVQD